MDKIPWCTDPTKSHLQYWAQDLHTVINTDSFDGNPKHIQKAETTIYTDGSKTDHGGGAGFVIYHKNKRIYAESIHMLDRSTVFQAKLKLRQ